MAHAEDMAWLKDGACTKPDVNPDWWWYWGEGDSDNKKAIELCLSCPVFYKCMSWASSADPQLIRGTLYAGQLWGRKKNTTKVRATVEPTTPYHAPDNYIECRDEKCDNLFKSKRDSNVFCSSRCQARAAQHVTWDDRNCTICAKLFNVTHGSQKFCSPRCKNRAKKISNAKLKRIREEKICAYPPCSNTFSVRQDNHVFCSRKCARTNRLHSSGSQTCQALYCDNEFTTNRRQKYCSSMCQRRKNKPIDVRRFYDNEPTECRLEECEVVFVPKSKNNVFCTTRCREKSRFLRWNYLWRENRSCNICDRSFTPRTPTQVYCTLTCSRSWEARKARKGKK